VRVEHFKTADPISSIELESLEQTFVNALRQTKAFSEVQFARDSETSTSGSSENSGTADHPSGLPRQHLLIQVTVLHFLHQNQLERSVNFLPQTLMVPALAAPLAAIHQANFIWLHAEVSSLNSGEMLMKAAAYSHSDCLICAVQNVNSRLAERIAYDGDIRSVVALSSGETNWGRANSSSTAKPIQVACAGPNRAFFPRRGSSAPTRVALEPTRLTIVHEGTDSPSIPEAHPSAPFIRSHYSYRRARRHLFRRHRRARANRARRRFS
jgi:hypothetical protein